MFYIVQVLQLKLNRNSTDQSCKTTGDTGAQRPCMNIVHLVAALSRHCVEGSAVTVYIHQSFDVIYSMSFLSLILLEVDSAVLLFLNCGVAARK
jgi:hypothetical protein